MLRWLTSLGVALVLVIGGGFARPSQSLAATGRTGTYFAQQHMASDARIRPKTLEVSGDSTLWISDVRWSSWSHDRAAGTGTSHVNSCNPGCSSGRIQSDPVRVTLTGPAWHCGQWFFGELTMHWPDGKPSRAGELSHQSLYPIECPPPSPNDTYFPQQDNTALGAYRSPELDFTSALGWSASSVHWSSWRHGQAHGRGTVTYYYGADSKERLHAAITLFRARVYCGSVHYFTRATLTYSDSGPVQAPTTWKFTNEAAGAGCDQY